MKSSHLLVVGGSAGPRDQKGRRGGAKRGAVAAAFGRAGGVLWLGRNAVGKQRGKIGKFDFWTHSCYDYDCYVFLLLLLLSIRCFNGMEQFPKITRIDSNNNNNNNIVHRCPLPSTDTVDITNSWTSVDVTTSFRGVDPICAAKVCRMGMLCRCNLHVDIFWNHGTFNMGYTVLYSTYTIHEISNGFIRFITIHCRNPSAINWP